MYKKKFLEKVLAIVLAVNMSVSAFPATVFAAGAVLRA